MPQWWKLETLCVKCQLPLLLPEVIEVASVADLLLEPVVFVSIAGLLPGAVAVVSVADLLPDDVFVFVSIADLLPDAIAVVSVADRVLGLVLGSAVGTEPELRVTKQLTF